MKRCYGIKRFVIIIAALFMLVGGLIIFFYPALSNAFFNDEQRSAITRYKKQALETEPAKLEEMMAKAQEYNEALLQLPQPLVSAADEQADYNNILDFGASGIMGYIDIEEVGIHLPIRHGVAENTLQTAVGHLEGSSFPIGSESSHTVLAGHNGLPSAKLFTDIDQLGIGDVFRVTVLTQEYDYKIDKILTVLPEEVEKELSIAPGEDHITLMTCTPYGVNTHRLLVRGTRYIKTPEEKSVESKEAVISESLPFVIVGIILFVLVIVAVVFIKKRKKRVSKASKSEKEGTNS